jgi:hypothetical protein
VRKARVDEIPPPFHPNHKSHETHRRTSSPAPPSSKGKRYELRGSEGGASWYHDYIDSLERHEGVNGGHCPTRRLLIGSTCLRRGRDFSPPPSFYPFHSPSDSLSYSCLRTATRVYDDANDPSTGPGAQDLGTLPSRSGWVSKETCGPMVSFRSRRLDIHTAQPAASSSQYIYTYLYILCAPFFLFFFLF